MKKAVLTVVTVLIFLLVAPITITLVGFCSPPQFGDTYYGELSRMFGRLTRTEGKKIVLIGNSAVAFGIRSDLLEREFPDYSVVNFGLYGALGTKLMLDLSKPSIGDGDIVIIMPELIEQSVSLYFSAEDTWRAVDGDFSMLGNIASENIAEMVGRFPGYVGEKFGYMQTGGAAADGAYSSFAFEDESGNDAGYMTCERTHNVMAGGYDSTSVSAMDVSIIGEGFIDYLNEYGRYVSSRGADVYFGFVPVNELMISENDREGVDDLYSFLCDELDFEVLGHPAKYFLDHRWFYDNNVHMNSSGMFVFTDLLAEDLKLELGITTPNNIEIPPPPEIPFYDFMPGDNRDAGLFVYEKVAGVDGEYIRLTGLTAEGKTKSDITVPTDYDGIPVREFDVSVFSGNTVVSRIMLPETIRRIYDGSFDGATRLSSLVFKHDSLTGISAGYEFLRGADNCYIYLKKGVSIAGCAGGWVEYQKRIRYY